MAPRECRYEPRDILLATQRQASQLKPGCPPSVRAASADYGRIRQGLAGRPGHLLQGAPLG